MKSTKNYQFIRSLCLMQLFAILPSLAIGQTDNNTRTTLDDNIIPPSPQAQEMIRYGEIPASLYTGTPNISIPIYTIKTSDISIPITLNYDASGVKVDQEAGTVGLGWALHTGGVVTHTIMGSDDLYGNYYFNEGSDNMKDLTLAYNVQNVTVCAPIRSMPIECVNGMDNLEFLRRISDYTDNQGASDFAPDVFNYSFGPYSGQFIFTHNREIVKDKEDNVKIAPIWIDKNPGRIISSWVFTTPDGTKYYFDQQEEAVNEALPPQNGRRYISSFYLTKIITRNNTSLEFKYNTSLGNTRLIYSRNENDRLEGGQISVSSMTYPNICLQSITYPGGEVYFSYDELRTDYSAPKLNYIHVWNDNGQQLNWNFDYSYFVSNTFGNDSPNINYLRNSLGATYYNDNWNTQRLRLDGAHQISSSDTLSYVFGYNEEHLPTKLSTSQDHWGYFNNAKNVGLIPLVLQNVSFTSQPNMKYFGRQADRAPNSDYNQAFLLNRIKYPTGGYEKLVYEANTYQMDNFEGDSHKKDYYYEYDKAIISENQYNGKLNATNDQASITVDSENGRSGQALFKISFRLNDTYFRSYQNRSSLLSFKLLNNYGSAVWEYTVQSRDILNKNTNENKNFYKTFSRDIPSGNLTMQVTGEGRTFFLDSLNFEVKTLIYPTTYMRRHPIGIGGGVRIAEVEAYDMDGIYQYGKKYLYTNNASTFANFTSGKLMSYPRYTSFARTINKNPSDGSYIKFLETSADGLRDKGTSVGYSEVATLELDKYKHVIGQTSYQYINRPDSIFYYYFDNSGMGASYLSGKDLNPNNISPYKFNENGFLLSEKKFLVTPSGSTLREYTQNEYNKTENIFDIYWGIRKDIVPNNEQWDEKAIQKLLQASTISKEKEPVGYLYPALLRRRYDLKRKTANTYRDGNTFTTTTNYAYNSKFQLVSQELRTPTDVDVNSYQYPQDVENDAVYRKLTEENCINTPVSVTHTRNGKSSSTSYHYSLFSDVPRVSSIVTNTGDNGEEEIRSTIKKYDTHGNILEVINESNIPMVYLWGYNYQYPIAVIKNATLDEVVAAYGINTERLGSGTDSINLDRSKLPKSQITTYSYISGVGISTVTDVNGLTTHYTYDSMGRLTAIVDPEGHLVESYQYNIK
ncbi:RHS repeat domain-containing protein [Segatella paludivivens]|uniref:RHS repeat domain-containing protein n=1 Tax=Segatella paludivivens TaxID=185294 RepID=UPI00037A5A99|nr:RHS repeat domain-containing protein [Segatella paludivivens]